MDQKAKLDLKGQKDQRVSKDHEAKLVPPAQMVKRESLGFQVSLAIQVLQGTKATKAHQDY